MEFKDYYAILGVNPQTPLAEIKRSYRKLARQFHPDVSKEPNAENRFKEVNAAWQVLQDAEKRARYDAIRRGGWQESGQGHKTTGPRGPSYTEQQGDFSDFFQSIFGGMGKNQAEEIFKSRNFQRPGEDYTVKVKISLDTASQGGEQVLDLQLPSGRKNLKIKVPPGVQTGSQLRLKGQGGPGRGTVGDLFVEFEIEPHPYFSLVDKDIHLTLPITPWEAALGASVMVPTLAGAVNLKITPNSQSGKKMRLKGRGMPGSPPGDQLVTLSVFIPTVQTEKEKELFEAMAGLMDFNPRKGLGV